MTPTVDTKRVEIDVSEVQMNKDDGKAPFVTRTIFADEREALIISDRRAAKNAQEVVGSKGFDDLLDRYDGMFVNSGEDLASMLEKRKIEESQRIFAFERGDFKNFCNKIANYDSSLAFEIEPEEFDKQINRFKGLLNYWLGLRSSIQVEHREKGGSGRQTTAQIEEKNLERSISELIQKFNIVAGAVGSKEKIEINENMYLGAVETIVGAARNSLKKVFRVYDGDKG